MMICCDNSNVMIESMYHIVILLPMVLKYKSSMIFTNKILSLWISKCFNLLKLHLIYIPYLVIILKLGPIPKKKYKKHNTQNHKFFLIPFSFKIFFNYKHYWF